MSKYPFTQKELIFDILNLHSDADPELQDWRYFYGKDGEDDKILIYWGADEDFVNYRNFKIMEFLSKLVKKYGWSLM